MPAPTLVATPGDATANTYATLARAVTLVAAMLGATAWDDADDEDRARALLTATARLDEREWVGRKATSTQALKWPRYGVRDEDTRPIASDVIPAWLERATVLLALALLRDAAAGTASGTASASTSAATDLAGFKAVEVGPIKIELAEATSETTAVTAGSALRGADAALPADVVRLISRYVRGGIGGTTRLVRA